MTAKQTEAQPYLREEAKRRILVLDGAMGTQFQGRTLVEDDFRGDLFPGWSHDLKGNYDVLNLTRPDIVKDIHLGYLEAGADIVETNTFSSTRIAQGDYGLQDHAYALNKAGAEVARAAADEMMERTPEKPRFVAGAIGPTNTTASISPDVNNPGFRAISFDELREAYAEAVRGLADGGADLILIETVFDTLNAKAAVFAIEDVFEEKGVRLPVMISGTITDRSGRTLSGQTPEAFWFSVRHARPFAVGLNCALGAEEMRPHIEEISRVADTLVICYPNAGLPNAFGGYDETPAQTSALLEEFGEAGFLNIVGGCCGTTPEHIRAIADAVSAIPPRTIPKNDVKMRLSGLEPFIHA